MMEYNVCEICGAKDGRAGLLIGNPTDNIPYACINCNDTRNTGIVTLHTHLIRTPEEIQKTIEILSEKKKESESV